MEDITFTDEEILSFARSQGFSDTKIKKLRDAGLYPSPIDRVGLGRGKGVTWIYPISAKEKIVRLRELTGQNMPYNEIKWHLWTEGYITQWEDIKTELIRIFPGSPPMVDEYDDLQKFEGSFLPFIRKFTLRNKIFNSFQLSLMLPVALYLMWPILFGQEYSTEDLRREDLELFFSEETIDFHETIVSIGIYDPRLWFKTLKDVSPETGYKMAKAFRLLDEDLDKPKNKGLNRLLHIRSGNTNWLWKIRAVLAGLLACLFEREKYMKTLSERN